MQDKYSLLQSVFGYTEFRKGQEQVIDALVAGRDAVGIMPTGAGKSLCFQIPALLRQGVAVIVSPLISLMKDQVNALTQAGISAAFINSSLTAAQMSRVLQNVADGKYKILYVAPERLMVDEFLLLAHRMELSFLAVDEAHCVSQWGQDFRPSYLRIHEFIDSLPTRPVVGAFTATATPQVRDDMIGLLELREPEVVTTGFNRDNLYFEVQSPKSKFSALESFLTDKREKSGIVYCLTRKNVEDVCHKLQLQGFLATRYHAGLPDTERKENQEAFQTDAATIMVATNAFGMGIDKSNVAFVVHYNMPKNMESYYQEAGRAGRDGSPADCILFYSGQDVVTNQFFIEKSSENDAMNSEALAAYQQAERDRLRKMTFYCHTSDCLRQYILHYFSEQADGFCGNCYNCLHHFEQVDVTVDAQKILSCVKRMGERYGIKLLVDTLRGVDNEKLSRLGFDTLSTYGILESTGEKRIREMVNHLIMQGYLTQSNGEYPTLRLAPRARELLFDGGTLSMNVGKEDTLRKKKKAATPEVSNPALFERLRELRGELAKKQSVPAYVIFPDASLRDMCEKHPRTEAEFLNVSGVGESKLTRYGAAFLEILNEDTEETAE